MHRATLVAAALAFVTAAPASALSGLGVAEKLRVDGTPLITTSKTAKGKSKRSSCEAGTPAAAKTSGLAGEVGRAIAPVACEQPPRSELLPPGALERATHAALAVLG